MNKAGADPSHRWYVTCRDRRTSRTTPHKVAKVGQKHTLRAELSRVLEDRSVRCRKAGGYVRCRGAQGLKPRPCRNVHYLLGSHGRASSGKRVDSRSLEGQGKGTSQACRGSSHAQRVWDQHPIPCAVGPAPPNSPLFLPSRFAYGPP